VYQIKKDLKNEIGDKNSVLLFTGDKGSSLLLDVVKETDISIVFIDTGHQFDEVIDYIKNYSDRIEVIRNDFTSTAPEIDMSICCRERKVNPLKEYLDNKNAQCLIVPFVNEEKDNGIEDSYLSGLGNIQIIKPLADLSESEIWMIIKEKKLPFSRIYNKGYKFVDCKCCMTRHDRRKQYRIAKTDDMDKETEEKLKALGYM